MEELSNRGKSIDDIAECLKGMPLHPSVVSVIKSAHALGYRFLAISFSCSVPRFCVCDMRETVRLWWFSDVT